MTNITLQSKVIIKKEYQGFELEIVHTSPSAADVNLDGEKVGSIVLLNGLWRDETQPRNMLTRDPHPLIPAYAVIKNFFS